MHFSEIFGVDSDALDAYGAFDISLINDLPLFVDPFLLFTSDKPDYQRLHAEIIRYLKFLRDRSVAGEVDDGLLDAWFTFREVRQNWFGFSKVGNGGSGLGEEFGRALNRSLNSIFRSFGDETVTNGSHLEKLCLIKDGVGRDNISDFTTTLIKEFLLDYTQTFARTYVAPEHRRVFNVEKVRFDYDTRSWVRGKYELPAYHCDFVLLTPKDLLTKDEIWINRPELLGRVEEIAEALPNQTLRAQVSQYFHGQLSKKPTDEEVRTARAATLERFPELIEHYIRSKEDTGDQAESVSTQKVRWAETAFIDDIKALRKKLADWTAFYETEGSTLEEARERVLFLKDVIENKDGYRVFYHDGKPINREDHLHLLYRLTWFGTSLDVNREVNNGRGPADYKVSRGARSGTIVEFKLASNSKLKQNLEKQAEIYQRASDAPHALKVILYFTEREHDRVSAILGELKIADSPDVLLIDARRDNKPSASNA
ncbi:MAG: hypothetical protein H0W53_14850 [Acidobacteria bacterium]|nr:hypothetical protein [Acidobacteriota bacterium]